MANRQTVKSLQRGAGVHHAMIQQEQPRQTHRDIARVSARTNLVCGTFVRD